MGGGGGWLPGSGGVAGAAGSTGGNGQGGQAGGPGGTGASGGTGLGGRAGSGGAAGSAGGAGVGGGAGTGGAAGQATGGSNAGSGGGAGTAGTGATGGTGGVTTAGPFTCSGTILGIADFDGDGTPDCVVTTPVPNQVLNPSIYLVFLKGLGNNSYSQIGVLSYGLPANAFGISTADLSGDGLADLTVSCSLTGSIAGIEFIYLKAHSDGTFTSGSSVTFSGVGHPVSALSAGTGDFNSDGKLDLLVAAWENDHNSQSVYWLLVSDKGSTKLSAGFLLGALGGPLSPGNVPGDFNGDGKLDVALAFHFLNLGQTTNTQNVAIAYGHGDGTFAAPVNVPGTSGGTAVSVGDLNSDGKLDLDVSLATLVPFYGDGAGNFSTTPP